jgi:hypothetical protein
MNILGQVFGLDFYSQGGLFQLGYSGLIYYTVLCCLPWFAKKQNNKGTCTIYHILNAQTNERSFNVVLFQHFYLAVYCFVSDDPLS